MPKKYYSVQNKAGKSVDIMIYGIIGDSWYEESVTARQFIADLKALEKDFTRINVRINSPGGSVFDGLPIFNALRSSTSDIHTYNDGLCASMAGLVLLAGKTVHTADNALLMLHSPMSGCQGNASDIQQVLEMLDKVQDSLVACITSRGTSTAETIKAKFFDYKDHWLNADEAEKEGFIDVVEKGDNKVSNKVTNMSLSEIMNQFDTLVKGRSMFDKFFSQAHDFFTPQNFIDMDIKVLRKACGLADDASEQDVLDFLAKKKEENDDTSGEDDAQDDNEDDAAADDAGTGDDAGADDDQADPKDKKIIDLENQIAILKKAPGAVDKKVTKETDSDKPATDSFSTYQKARVTLDAVNSLMK